MLLTSISSYYCQEHLMHFNMQRKTKAIKMNSKSNCCCQMYCICIKILVFLIQNEKEMILVVA